MHSGYSESRGTAGEPPSTRTAHSGGLLSRRTGILLLHSIWLFIDRSARYDHVCVYRNDVYDIRNALLRIVRDCKVNRNRDRSITLRSNRWCSDVYSYRINHAFDNCTDKSVVHAKIIRAIKIHGRSLQYVTSFLYSYVIRRTNILSMSINK